MQETRGTIVRIINEDITNITIKPDDDEKPATEDEKERAALRGWKCGDEIDDMDYVLYDEAEYDQRMQQTEVQSPMKK